MLLSEKESNISSVDLKSESELFRISIFRSEIELLSILGDYKEATELLINLNRSYPNYGEYAELMTSPLLDKIKSEYPPFVDALNNLKLPPKPDLEGLVKL